MKRSGRSLGVNSANVTMPFAGPEFTAADIQMSYPLEAAASRSPIIGKLPKVKAFIDRIHARPAYKRAIERGGEYALAK